MKYIFVTVTMLIPTVLVACAVLPSTATQTTADDMETSITAESPIPATAGHTADEAEVRALVENFGKRLQLVSLLSPTAAQDIQNQFAEFVSPTLLERWTKDVSNAPGGMVSSPWPDRIEITALSREDVDRYAMTGFVVEITSTEVGTGEAAAKIPVHIVLERGQSGWLITEYTEENNQRGLMPSTT